MQLSALARFLCLHLVAATPAAPPGSIVILEPGENSFTIQWSPGASNDCNFQAWQVQLRSRNLNGTLVGSWRQATEVPTSRDSPNCTVDGLQRNSPYDLQIFERCANGADDSSAGEPEEVLWTLPGYWEIHIPPHDASSYVVEDTLEAHAGCEVIKSCCDDQFSLCFSGNESRTVEVQRVDTELGWWQQVGWGQDLYLRCHAPSVAAFKNDPISKEVPEPPWYLRLYEPTHVTAQVVFHHGNFIGGCQCANHQLQTRPHGSTTWRNESGDCLVRDSRHCNIQELQANARIYGRIQTTCLDESMNSNWSEVVELITRPACTWTYDSNRIQGAAANELECVDKTFCDFDADSSCCASAGGRLRCPQNYPVMCENQDCVGSTDYCCVSTEAECGSHGGVRVCSASMVPAEVPRFEDFNSYLASSLKITWSRGIYLSEDDSPCQFSMWHLEVAESYDDGSTGSWVLMSNCATLPAEATSCEVGPDQGLISLQKYVVRMKEICTDAKLNSELSYAASVATTWPMRAYPVSDITFSNIRDDAATISWVPGVAYERHVQECDFHHWEVMIRMASRYVQAGRAFGAISWDAELPERDDLYLEYEEGTDWYVGCRSFTREQSSCDPASLESDRDYAVMVRERCLDSNADGDYLTSSSLLRTAAAAAHAPVNFTIPEIRKYSYELSWDPGDRRACVFWAWQVMTKPVGVDWPPEEQDNASIAGGDHFFIYSRNITEARFKLPLGSNTQYGARVRERCTKAEFDGEWGYLLYPGVWTAPPVQAERLSNVTFLFNWPALLSIRFFAGPEGWLEDLDPAEEGYNSHSDCEFQGWYVEVADTSTPDSWVVQQECLVLPRSFEGCDIYSGLEYGKEYHLRLREGCTDPSARSPEYLTTVTARDRTPAAVPFDVKKNSDTAFSYEFSWEPGTSYDCVFLRWEVQLRSINDTNSSAAAYGDGRIEDIRSRIYGHSQNPGGVSSSDWSVPVEACTLPTNRELAWCRIEPLLPNAFIDLRVREICEDSALYSPYAVLETVSPEAPTTQFTAAAFVAASDEGNSLQMQFSGANVGDCLDALPQIEVKEKGQQFWTRITEVSYALSQNPPHEPHDLISGVITALGLQPNTLYFGQVRLFCPSGSHKDGPFFEAQQSAPTMPGCKWSRHSNRTQMAECSDGSFCNFTADESCCSNLQRCPPERPWLCDSGSCQVDCASFGGDRACSPSEWPANMPQIVEANSFSPATLTLSWAPQGYLSGNVSSCNFSRWDLQLAKVAADGSLEAWVPLTHCFYEGSRQQHSCQVEDLDFLQYYQVRFAELCEDSALDSLYNWTHPILIRGALAGSPVNITMTVLSQSDIHIRWDASTSASDCSFYAWEVQWRLASSTEWTSAADCQDLIYRNQTECIIRELSAMTSYVVRITESCTDVRTNSLPADTPTFRFREVDDWEIYLGPSAGMTLAVSTLSKEVDHCEVITTCCDDQFSICYSTSSTEELIAVSRTDFVAGWGQQLWLRCFANGINPLSEEIASAAPQWIELQNPSRSSMSASYSLGQAPGHCLCAHPHLQLKAADDTAWVSYGGDCADMSLRACSVTDLVPDRIYMARLQVACANSSLNSPWTYSVEATTDPGCKWSSSSGNSTGYECKDGSFCSSPGCCSGKLLRCPDVMPIMCSDVSCSGDHCCVASSSGCAAHGGVRSCYDTEVPAKEPTIQSVISTSPSTLLVTWAAGDYASGFTSPCAQGGISEFVAWALEISLAEADEWQSVLCETLTSRSSTSCSIDQLMPNTAYQVRLAEICLHNDLDSDYTVSAVAVTLPSTADSPSALLMELSDDMLKVSWTPGPSAGHCVFQNWELQWRWWSLDSDWTSKTCGFLRSSSECMLDRPSETIELRVRERCQDPNADSAFLLSAPFKWSSVEDWQVYVGSSSVSSLAVDVLTLPMDVTTSTGTATFSLCFGTSQMVGVTRTDALDGWSEEVWLHCSLRDSESAAWSAPSAPSSLTLVPFMNALKGASLDASFEAVLNLGSGCTCGRFELELQALNYSTAYGYAQDSQLEKPSGCSSVSLASRSCSAESLRPDAVYQALLRVQCDEGGSDAKSGSFLTPPACKWVTDSGYADLYECLDGLLCNSTSCCNGHGGRARCPQAMPVMCAKNLDCADGQDRCCMASDADCASHSGVRPCFYAEIPAKAPVITQVLSPAPGQLLVQWQHASYLNGDRSRCSFTSWRVEVAQDLWSDGEATWQLASECSEQDRPVTSCLLQNLVSNSNYSVRLREACTRMDYDSDWALWPSAFTLPTAATAPTASCVEPAAQRTQTMTMQVSWTPGSAGDCSFEAWEIEMQLLPNSMTNPSPSAWMLACRSNQDTSCYVDALLSGRYYAVRIRQVCVNPLANSAYSELTGTECLVTAMPASSPVNLTAVSLSPYDVDVTWAAMHPWACSFYAWQVQVKAQAEDNWEASGFGCFSYDRDVANCTVNVGLGSNTPYDVRVRETCLEPTLNSSWLQLAFPGVSTPLPVTAGTPTMLTVSKVSAFELRATWQPGGTPSDCSFSSWEVLILYPDTVTTEALPCPSPRGVGQCEVSLRTLTLTAAGSYGLQVREICSDPLANSAVLQQDSALELGERPASISDLMLHDAGETWMLFTWVSGLSSCSSPQYQIHWRQLTSVSWALVLCQALPCNVTGLAKNLAYEVLVEEACESPWSIPTIENESSTFWTMPGEWSTFIGSSHSMVVSVMLTETPHRCYVQKECCADEFAICHDAANSRSVQLMRVDVPGGWGQRLTLLCVQPVLSTISLRPEVQVIGPESLLLAPRDNESVTVVYPLRMAAAVEGCECPDIVLEMATQGSNLWLPMAGDGGLCKDWNSRECVVDGLVPGTTYEGRVQISCQASALSSIWTYAGATVTTNLEALVVEGSISVTAAPARRLSGFSAARRLAEQSALQKVLSEVTGVELRSVLVTTEGSDMAYLVAASTLGSDDAESASELEASAAQRRLEDSFATDFSDRLSTELGSSVEVKVVLPPAVERRSEAFPSCGLPPSVANSARNWSSSSCLGRTWSDGPCDVPCDVGFLPEGGGYLCGLDGTWSSGSSATPRCASIWSVGDWGTCQGVADDCGDGGMQLRQVTCPEASGCHAMSRPTEEQSCRATSGCLWVEGLWSTCSNDCGVGERSRSITCSSPLTSDCADKALPVNNESCSDYSNCQWQIRAWSLCSSSCGVGTQTREVTCEADPHCPSPSPSLVQYCYETASCFWQTSSWSACSNTCGAGTAERQVWCSSGSPEDCAGSVPAATQSCYETVGCTWQKGSWSSCSSSCGPGQRQRDVTCPSGQAEDCPGSMPAIEEDCYETNGCVWVTQSWETCDNRCGSGTRTRAVYCSLTQLDADCAAAGAKPVALEGCYDVVGCAWLEGTWSACSATCGIGLRSRSVSCPSGWPADCAQFQVEPVSTETCRGTSTCAWRIGDWSSCSNDCGDGTMARSVQCSSGEDMDCTTSKPATSQSCRVTSGCGWTISAWSNCDATCGAGVQRRSAVCDSGRPEDCTSQPVVVQSCYATSGCSWLQGDWSTCSTSCGLGLRQRSVTCSSGEDSDCVAGERPSSSEACYEQSGCRWQSSPWSSCSASCGNGLRTRQVWCDSLVDADCQGDAMPVRSESCYNTSSCTWHEGTWSECSNDCGDGFEVRSISCSGPGGDVDCATRTKPSDSRSCFSAANCAWQVAAWQLCNVSCGIGHQERVVHCPTGSDSDCPAQRPSVLQRCYRQDGCRWLEGQWGQCSGSCEAGTRSRNVTCLSGDASDCSQVTRPLDQEACNQQAAGCLWSVGPWGSCSALSCGALGSRVREVLCPSRHGTTGCAASKPREVEACLSETLCEWRYTEWSDCDASCGSGVSSRVVSCSAGRDEECPGEKPASSKECYSTSGCQWWTGQWGNCNATCGLGYETRSLVCGAASCDPGSAPVSVRACRSTTHCEWQIGDWGPCSTFCGDGVSSRLVACPSGEDADCAFSTRPLDRKECRNVTGCTWSTSSWSVCSQSCGEGTQTRAVLCPSGSAADCEASKPTALQSCQGRLGCQWQMGDWSSCSSHCGDGTRARSVRCSGTELEHCNASTRPLAEEPCSGSACVWRLGEWSPCSTRCGDGVQHRSVQCNEPSCGESPASQQVCFETVGCHWLVGSWSNCSEGCGLGTRSREIRCSGGPQEFCSAQLRPADRQLCDAESTARSIGPSCGWDAGAWSACVNCGPQQREVTCSASCFGKAPSALRPCQDAACADQGNASARFEVSLLMDELSTELLSNLVAGTREAVAEMLQVSPADVQVAVVNETARTRRLSVRLTLEVEVVSSAGSVAMLSSELGKEMLHTELLETWDEKGLPLEDFSVLVSSVESAETSPQATQAPSESALEQAPNVSNLAVLVVVVCTLLCSAVAGALYCWRWQRVGATVVPQSPKLQPPTSPCPIAPGAEALKSPKGGASPAAVSAMRRAASQSDATKPTLTLPVEARKVVPEPRASNDASNAGSERTTEAVGMTEEANDMKERLRPTSLQVRVVQPGEKPSARAVRVTNATVTRSSTAVSSSSRSPLSHAPRPSGDVSAGSWTQRSSRSEPHRLPLEPMGEGQGLPHR